MYMYTYMCIYARVEKAGLHNRCHNLVFGYDLLYPDFSCPKPGIEAYNNKVTSSVANERLALGIIVLPILH